MVNVVSPEAHDRRKFIVDDLPRLLGLGALIVVFGGCDWSEDDLDTMRVNQLSNPAMREVAKRMKELAPGMTVPVFPGEVQLTEGATIRTFPEPVGTPEEREHKLATNIFAVVGTGNNEIVTIRRPIIVTGTPVRGTPSHYSNPDQGSWSSLWAAGILDRDGRPIFIHLGPATEEVVAAIESGKIVSSGQIQTVNFKIGPSSSGRGLMATPGGTNTPLEIAKVIFGRPKPLPMVTPAGH